MKLAALFPVLCLASSAYAENLLVNGSFEQPVVPLNGLQSFAAGETIGAGWIIDSSQFGAAVLNNGYTDPGGSYILPGSSVGAQYFQAGRWQGSSQGASVIHQDVLLSGQTAHKLTFDLATFLVPAIGAQVNIDVLLNGASVLPGGAVAFTKSFVDTPTVYRAKQLDFTTTDAGVYQIQIRSFTNGASFVDNFALVVVPPPGSAAILGLGMLSGTRRRRA